MEPDEFLARLRARLPGEVAGPDARETELLLDLARVAAHRSERWAAPVSTYLAGLAVAGRPAADRVRALGAVLAALEDGSDDVTGP